MLDTLIPRNISLGEVVFGLAAAGLIAGYVAFILGPTWLSYGRIWERLAASVLTLFILAALLGVGAAIGFAVVVFYDNFA